MPHVVVKMHTGRSEAAKRDLARAIADAVVAGTGCRGAAVSVAIEDVPPERWTEDVWLPDIAGRRGDLYVEPGYDPATG